MWSPESSIKTNETLIGPNHHEGSSINPLNLELSISDVCATLSHDRGRGNESTQCTPSEHVQIDSKWHPIANLATDCTENVLSEYLEP